ncbi:MAG: carboxypeptidase regulatory-like domain-containing protein, partial [Zavarzinella sp.]|nr:carboxypeptidase regulatory-like domain-containing protein [Zavarzinella sp.]
PMAKTTGRLVDAKTGKGIPKATVALYLGSPQVRHVPFDQYVESDGEGRFVAYGPPGEWGRPVLFDPPAGYTSPEPEIKAVKLDPKAPHAFPDLKLRPTVGLRGVVVDEAGQPVAGPEVWPGRVNIRGPGQLEALAGKADGTFAIPDLDPDDVVAPRVRKKEAVNVPTPVEVGKQDGPVKVTLSPKNACRIRGRVTDTAGRPLAGAKVGVTWHYWGLGRESQYGTSRGVESLTTDADGRFESRALWPGDNYNVTASHEGYGKADSGQVTGGAGQVHDLGTLKLVATGLSVRGTVVGTDGKPVAGVNVFNRGDGPGAMSTTTGADGTFMLKGFFDAPGFVFAKKDGYRFAFAPVRPGGEAVTVTLRTTAEPPAPVPGMEAHEAALQKFTRWLLERLWAEREHLGGYERNVFSGMARFDPDTARKWRDEEKERTGGKTDYTRLLNNEEREQTIRKKANDDIDEALALYPKAKRSWDIRPVLKLGEDFLATDKAKALRAAEEAAVRARALDPGDRAWILALAGDLAVKAGNAAGGKKLLSEAAELAGKLPMDGRNNLNRKEVAAALAPHDESAALRLIDVHTEPDNYSWALAGVIDGLAEKDPDRAEALLPKMRPGNSHAPHEAQLAIAYRVAEKDPDR